MFRLLLALSFLGMMSCKSADLRKDHYPAPMDNDVYQTRLEFQGCGFDSLVGSIVCFPSDTEVKIRTDFPGSITVISKGEGCLRQEDLKATIPYTIIKLPKRDRICTSAILYQPKFVPEPDMEIRGVFGELIQYSNKEYTKEFIYLGHHSKTLFQTVELTVPEKEVRGWYWGRYMKEAKPFQGQLFSFDPPGLGSDLLQIKAFDAQNNPTYYLYTVNYYAPKAMNLSVKLEEDGKKLLISFPDEVTVVSIEGQMEFWRSFKISKDFTGYIRAYTVKGRTLVVKLNKGAIQWIQ